MHMRISVGWGKLVYHRPGGRRLARRTSSSRLAYRLVYGGPPRWCREDPAACRVGSEGLKQRGRQPIRCGVRGGSPGAGLVVPRRRAGLDFGYPAVKDACMTSEASSAAKSGQESVVIASFDSYRHAEHMLASLGRGFRKKARKGGATALVVRGNADGSLKVTESRVLSASDLVSTVLRVSLSWTIGFMGLLST